jgi:uncharacterized protein YwgA
MNQLAQKAILVGLAKRLSGKGSWGGETHVQKAAYLLSELCGVDFDFDFILYKHGPFSFELHDELASMCAEGLMDRFLPSPRYGPRLLVTARGEELEQRLSKTMSRYGASLDWITDILGTRGVADLERLATAMWVTRQNPGGSVRSRAEALTGVKPHISLDDAIESVEEIDRLLDEQQTPAAI